MGLATLGIFWSFEPVGLSSMLPRQRKPPVGRERLTLPKGVIDGGGGRWPGAHCQAAITDAIVAFTAAGKVFQEPEQRRRDGV